MSRTLLIAEHDGKQLNPSTAKALTGALAVGHPVDIAVFAADAGPVAEQAASLEGADKVLKVERAENEHPLAATLAPQIEALAADYSHVFMPSTTFGKDVMPRAAALLGSPQVSDIMEVLDAHSFKRPIYANNVIVTVKAPSDTVVTGTIRTASFKDAPAGGQAEITDKSLDVELPGHSRFVELEVHKSDRPDLQSAQRVVSGGRGVGNKENFEIIYRIADKLGAGVGASRAAVDAGFVPNDMQVGQTGKIVAPELYMCFGISGAIQHVTGIKDAGTIVAVNKDPDAPIFEIADIGLVGDLFEIIPELEEKLG
ncbi:FAD-binding protein [Gammaproteobacteria bacterium AB-CW1]|uniref:Electron transfer flavoprotein subunit alpha n=1 Tax=Natronospira elongata TaxID=3110268 RepID=A0AAP6JFF6_9GAMM|nr:FAD-binding protein [Gammaproteobacteria bacterium AB-CW1]